MLKELNILKGYPSKSKGILLQDFLVSMFENSTSYKRSTAFFNGVLFSVIAASMKDFFIKNNGTMKIITSPVYDFDHINTFNLINEDSSIDIDNSLIDIFDLLQKEKTKELSLKLLSLLVIEKRLEIKIATPINLGLHHEKVGIFTDINNDAISFSGSVNETLFGWTKNNEQIRVFKNWEENEKEYFDIDESNFDSLWANKDPYIDVKSLSDSIFEEISKYSENLNLEEITNEIKSDKKIVSFIQNPDEEDSLYQLMEHQELVLSSWEQNNRKGIVKFATGAGKTFVGIDAIKRHMNDLGSKTCHALVIAPSILLQEQWVEQLELFLPNYSIHTIGGKTTKSQWKKTLSFLSTDSYKENNIFVATLGTAISKDFLSSFEFGDNILLVFDEVHRFGSIGSKVLLEKSFGSRLGLSATPERYNDKEGTDRIFSFFEKILEPEFTLEQSIKVGRLVPYYYNITNCILSEPEQEEYDKFTQKIIQLKRIIEDNPLDEEAENRLEKMYINRAKIPKKAINKIEITFEILENFYDEDSYWLIYCEDNEQLDSLVKKLVDKDYEVSVYTSSITSDHETILKDFKDKKGIMVAIRCLDEGIDIPYLNNAIILASSQNPRQFIQRRGRILRNDKDKQEAQLFDIVVVPREYNPNNEYGDTLILSELKRAYEFSKTAVNPTVLTKIELLAKEFGFNLDELSYTYYENLDEDKVESD